MDAVSARAQPRTPQRAQRKAVLKPDCCEADTTRATRTEGVQPFNHRQLFLPLFSGHGSRKDNTRGCTDMTVAGLQRPLHRLHHLWPLGLVRAHCAAPTLPVLSGVGNDDAPGSSRWHRCLTRHTPASRSQPSRGRRKWARTSQPWHFHAVPESYGRHSHGGGHPAAHRL
jgi:hypothetical protein